MSALYHRRPRCRRACELITLERDDDEERIAKIADADVAIVAPTRCAGR